MCTSACPALWGTFAPGRISLPASHSFHHHPLDMAGFAFISARVFEAFGRPFLVRMLKKLLYVFPFILEVNLYIQRTSLRPLPLFQTPFSPTQVPFPVWMNLCYSRVSLSALSHFGPTLGCLQAFCPSVFSSGLPGALDLRRLYTRQFEEAIMGHPQRTLKLKGGYHGKKIWSMRIYLLSFNTSDSSLYYSFEQIFK